MRSLSGLALFAAVLVTAAPAVAQVAPPGAVYYGQQGAPIPNAPNVQQGSPGGPVYHNQNGAPMPGAPYTAPQGNPQVQNGRVWQNGRWVSLPAPSHNNGPGNGNRWGQNVNGRWWAGSQAPGGWGGYRRPRRGAGIDPYWMQPGFQIPDYLSFGLAAPPYGFFWVRYYDDAVLIDAQGSVQASVSGIAWSGASASAGRGYASSSASAYSQQGGQVGYVDPNPPYYADPRGGYAPSAPYGQPTVQYQQGCPQQSCPPMVYTQQGGGYQQQGGYYNGGGYYAGGTTTTVVIQPGATITTTIIEEEVIEEEVVTTTYVRKPTRRIVRRAPARHRAKPTRRQCSCQCACR